MFSFSQGIIEVVDGDDDDDDEEDSQDMDMGRDDDGGDDDEDDDDSNIEDAVVKLHAHLAHSSRNIPHHHHRPNADVEDVDEEENDSDDDEDNDEEDLYNDQPPLAKYAHLTVSRLLHEENDGPRTMRLTSGGYSPRDQKVDVDFHSTEPT